MSERRHKRFTVEGIHGNMLFSSEIRIQNISIGGAAIVTTKLLNIGSEYTLKMEDKGNAFSVRGRVIWSELSESTKGPGGAAVPVYRTGLQFVDIYSESAAKLMDFLETHKMDSGDRLDGLRFNIHAPQRAVLSMPYGYKVKKISAGGMLIESSEEFATDSMYPMELFLPSGLAVPYGPSSKVVSFLGRVASCIEVPDIYPRHYDVGIEFLDMSEMSRKNLNEFLTALNSQ